jgi:hypothetical protein
MDDRRFEPRQVLGILLFTTASRPALGPIQPPIRKVPWALFLEVKRPGREADHLPPSSPEVRMRGAYLHSPNKPSWCGTQLKHSNNFTLPVTIQELVKKLISILTES